MRTLDELKALVEEREQELRQLYRELYSHPQFYAKEKERFSHLSISEKAGVLASIGSCWDAWVIKKGDEQTVDCFAVAQRWMQQRGYKYQHLNVSLGDVALQFQTLKNKRLKRKS